MPEDREEKERESEGTVEFGLGGLFEGLGSFVDLVSKMAETGERVVRKEGEFHIKGLEDKGKAVYGVNVRMGLGNEPIVQHFGDIRSTEEGPEVAEAREPLVDVFDEEKEIVVVVELPGVSEEEIEVAVQEDILSLETVGERKYAKEVLLPCPADSETLEQTYRNGILEIRLEKS